MSQRFLIWLYPQEDYILNLGLWSLWYLLRGQNLAFMMTFSIFWPFWQIYLLEQASSRKASFRPITILDRPNMTWSMKDLAEPLYFIFVLTSHDDNVQQDSIFGIYISSLNVTAGNKYLLYDWIWWVVIGSSHLPEVSGILAHCIQLRHEEMDIHQILT